MKDPLNSSFERNRYFNGKLLTTNDFKMEQNYFNNKRMLINRLFFGAGIVSGLNVIDSPDEGAIHIGKGIAIDSFGREVILEKDKKLEKDEIKKLLKDMNGEPDGFVDLYLCIKYKEEEKDLVRLVVEDRQETNVVKDSYEIFMTKDCPDDSDFDLLHLIENRKLLCELKDVKKFKTQDETQVVKVWQSVPKYVNLGDVFELKITVENGYFTDPVKLEYEIECDEFEHLERNSYDRQISKERSDRFKCPKMKCSGEYSGNIRFKNDKIKIHVGDREYEEKVQFLKLPDIISTSIREKILEDYFNCGNGDKTGNTLEDMIYLAKISLYNSQGSYLIKNVKNVSFDKRLVSLPLIRVLDELDSMRLEYKGSIEHDKRMIREMEEYKEQAAAASIKNSSSGTVYIDFGDQKSGNKYFSDEISHGLGIGPVYISTGIEVNYSDAIDHITRNDKQIFYGSYIVFEKSDYAPDFLGVHTGVVLYPNKGTFRIGVSIPSRHGISGVSISWWAFKNNCIKESEDKEIKIEVLFEELFIEVKKEEKIQLDAKVKGTRNKSLVWCVNEKDGGNVDQNGIYIAPKRKGVFSVTATSKEDMYKSGTVYMIVKD